MVPQRALGDFDGAAKVEDFFDILIGKIKYSFVRHRQISHPHLCPLPSSERKFETRP
jgi:hypothetical protein